MNYKFNDRGNLVLILDEEDKEEILELRERGNRTDEDILLELMEPMLCNGWHNVEIALWDGLTFTEDWQEDNHGEITYLGKVYTFTDHAIVSEIDVLLEDGQVVLTKVD